MFASVAFTPAGVLSLSEARFSCVHVASSDRLPPPVARLPPNVVLRAQLPGPSSPTFAESRVLVSVSVPAGKAASTPEPRFSAEFPTIVVFTTDAFRKAAIPAPFSAWFPEKVEFRMTIGVPPLADEDTGSRFDIAGRCVEGPLKGWTLEPADAVMVKWYAWAAEYPRTEIIK